jgi:alkylation response protein AidB-like acyl-CoA dehydrogenase
MDFAIPPSIEELRAKVRAFLEDRVLPREPEWLRWEEDHFPACVEDGEAIRALQAEARVMGVWAGHLPKEAGGMGLRVVEYGLLNEVIGRSFFAPRIFGSNAPDSGNAELLWHFGTPAQIPVVAEAARRRAAEEVRS